MTRVRGKLAPSFESKTGKRLLTFIVLVGLAYAFFREPAANQDVLKGLKADITKCSDQMKIAQRQGIVIYSYSLLDEGRFMRARRKSRRTV